MKKFFIQTILLLFVIAAAFYIYKGQAVNLPFLPQQTNFRQLTTGNTKINAEVADTSEKKSKGLGGRDNLASDSGMLFTYEKEDKYAFWMKGMKFPLDFIWIKGNKVLDITEGVQPPIVGQKDQDLTIYSSKEPIDSVLEVNAGFVKLHDIKVGDSVGIQM